MRGTIITLFLLLSFGCLIEAAALPHGGQPHGDNKRFKLVKRSTICYGALNGDITACLDSGKCYNSAGQALTRPCSKSNYCERQVPCPGWAASLQQ
ncbi:hypothetical protein HDK77DRAFT_197093 [Phyllosticta capitalensis]